MTASEISVESLAKEAGEWLEHRTRDDGEKFITTKDARPDWVQELCYEAHGDFLPDDWRYEFIEDALCQLENGDDEGRCVDDAYPYTKDRLNWIASNLTRPGYCDEAAKDYGMKYDDVLCFIATGMQQEMNETFDLVKSFLENRVEELESEAEESEDDDGNPNQSH